MGVAEGFHGGGWDLVMTVVVAECGFDETRFSCCVAAPRAPLSLRSYACGKCFLFARTCISRQAPTHPSH